MTKLLAYGVMALGLWLAVSPFVLDYRMLGMAVNVAVGVITIALAFVGTRSKTVQWNFQLLAVGGICLAIWGVGAGIALNAIAGANEAIVGILVSALSVICIPFQVEADTAQFFNRTGGQLASMTKISEKNGNLLVKAVLLGSMPETIFVRPEEVCKMVALIDIKVLAALPGYIYVGYKKNRAAAKAAKAATTAAAERGTAK